MEQDRQTSHDQQELIDLLEAYLQAKPEGAQALLELHPELCSDQALHLLRSQIDELTEIISELKGGLATLEQWRQKIEVASTLHTFYQSVQTTLEQQAEGKTELPAAAVEEEQPKVVDAEIPLPHEQTPDPATASYLEGLVKNTLSQITSEELEQSIRIFLNMDESEKQQMEHLIEHSGFFNEKERASYHAIMQEAGKWDKEKLTQAFTQMKDFIPLIPSEQVKTSQSSADIFPSWFQDILKGGASSAGNAEEIEKAIQRYSAELNNEMRQKEPLRWGMLIFQRGAAYMQYSGADHNQNIKLAISDFTDALTIFTRETSPQLWATLLAIRGLAYYGLLEGNRRQHLEHALSDFDESWPMIEQEESLHSLRSTILTIRVQIQDELGQDPQNVIEHLEKIRGEPENIHFPGKDAAEALMQARFYLTRKSTDRQADLEQVIVACDQALSFYTAPFERGIALTFQGTAYAELMQDDHAANLLRALANFDDALASFALLSEKQQAEHMPAVRMERARAKLTLFRMTQESQQLIEDVIQDSDVVLQSRDQKDKAGMYEDWLVMRGLAYAERLEGNKLENLKQAISDTTDAINLAHDKQNMHTWAMAHLNRATHHINWLAFTTESNQQILEEALADCEAALSHFTSEEHPKEWAQAISNRNLIFTSLGTANARYNPEQILESYKTVEKLFNPEHHPVEWAMMHLNYGNAYLERIAEDRITNARQAWYHFDKVCQAFSAKKMPILWAKALVNRGMARRYLIPAYASDLFRLEMGALGFLEKHKMNITAFTDAIKEAIVDFDAALTVFSLENTPYEWARTHKERGEAYIMLIGNENRQYIKEANESYTQALKVFTREHQPLEWAILHANRGLIYRLKVITDPKDDAIHALADFDAALSILTAEVKPLNYCDLQYSRSMMLERLGRWEEAHQALMEIRRVQRTLISSASTDSLRFDLIGNFALTDVYLRDAQVLLRLNPERLPEAVLALEEGRAQNMRLELEMDELLLNNAQDLAMHQQLHAFETARSHWREQQQKMLEPIPQSLSPSEVYLRRERQANDLQASYNEFFRTYAALPHYDDRDALLSTPTLEGILNCVAEPGEALVYVTTGLYQAFGGPAPNLQSLLDSQNFDSVEGGFAIIVAHNGSPYLKYVPLPRLIGPTLATFIEPSHSSLPIKLDTTVNQLGNAGLNELASELVAAGVYKVTFITYGRLGLFPLPAVRVRLEDGREGYLGDFFEISFAPCARVVELARQRAAKRTARRQKFLLVGNPKPSPAPNLSFAEAEADTIRRILKPRWNLNDKSGTKHISYLVRFNATREKVVSALAEAQYAHLAIHASYDPASPLTSYLVLSGNDAIAKKDRIITLREVMEKKVDLQGLRLLVLSACETSVVDVRTMPNEVMGLATGFLQAGVSGVIASLWKIDDQATFLLMTRFAQLYLDPQGLWSPARALAHAQRWLRTEATYSVLKTHDPLQQVIQQESESTMRSYYEALNTIQNKAAQNALDAPDTLPFADVQYWGAFIMTGC